MIKFLFTLTLSMVPVAALAAPLCADVHTNSTVQWIKQIAGTSLPNTIERLQRPGWKEYSEVAALVERLEKEPKKTPEEKKALRAQFQPFSKKLKADLELIEKDPRRKKAFEKFLDYHFAYFELLNKANRLLGAKVFAVPDLSFLKTNEQLKADAEAVVQSLETIAQETFSDLGPASYESFLGWMDRYSPKAQQKMKLVQDDLVVALHRPEGARFWVPLAGFQNQRVTGSSKGSYFDPIYGLSGRDQAEAKMTARKVEDFVPLSARFKPNYAEARPRADVHTIKPSDIADHYGSDLWIIKKEVIEKRATWYHTDSLGPGTMMPETRSLTSTFIPWKYRGLMAPYLLQSEIFKPEKLPDGVTLKLQPQYMYWYFEVQIFGPLTINDVQAFHFKQTPPDKAFYELLVSKGIEVWDERNWPAKKYNGEESK